MRLGIIYILMSIFLLFTAENKNYVDFQQTFGNQTSSTVTPKLVKKHLNSRTFEKRKSQDPKSSVDFLEEFSPADYQPITPILATLIVSIFTLGYIFHLLYLKRKKHFFDNSKNFLSSIRTFILLETIRL